MWAAIANVLADCALQNSGLRSSDSMISPWIIAISGDCAQCASGATVGWCAVQKRPARLLTSGAKFPSGNLRAGRYSGELAIVQTLAGVTWRSGVPWFHFPRLAPFGLPSLREPGDKLHRSTGVAKIGACLDEGSEFALGPGLGPFPAVRHVDRIRWPVFRFSTWCIPQKCALSDG